MSGLSDIKHQTGIGNAVAHQCLQNLWILWFWCCLELSKRYGEIVPLMIGYIPCITSSMSSIDTMLDMSWFMGWMFACLLCCSHDDMNKTMLHFANPIAWKCHVSPKKQTWILMDFEFPVDMFESQMLYTVFGRDVNIVPSFRLFAGHPQPGLWTGPGLQVLGAAERWDPAQRLPWLGFLQGWKLGSSPVKLR